MWWSGWSTKERKHSSPRNIYSGQCRQQSKTLREPWAPPRPKCRVLLHSVRSIRPSECPTTPSWTPPWPSTVVALVRASWGASRDQAGTTAARSPHCPSSRAVPTECRPLTNRDASSWTRSRPSAASSARRSWKIPCSSGKRTIQNPLWTYSRNSSSWMSSSRMRSRRTSWTSGSADVIWTKRRSWCALPICRSIFSIVRSIQYLK